MECEFRAHSFDPAPMKTFESLSLSQFGKARLNDCLAATIPGARQRMVH
jgi:hypothetical protein